MRVTYVYTWGYFHPATCGADLVAANHLAYFRDRGWAVDCVLARDRRKDGAEQAFRAAYPWLRSLTVADLPPQQWAFGDLLWAYHQFADVPAVRAVLEQTGDLFVTNYLFTAPLLRHVPKTARRVVETVDVLSDQFALAARPAPSPVANLRAEFLLKTELDLYRLFDAAIMINADEAARVRGLGVGHARYVPRWCPGQPTGTQDPAEFDLVYVASNNPINRDGIDWFYRRVYVPHLWRHGVRLGIAGGVCDGLHYTDHGVRLIGKVPGSLDPLYARSKIVVAPIFAGTGLSIKTVEALAAGKAVVAAPAAARGLDPTTGAFLTLDMKADPAGTAAAILELLADPGRRADLEARAAAFAAREYGWAAFTHGMDAALRAA